MGRHSRTKEHISHRGNSAFELPSIVDTYTISSEEKDNTTPLLYGVRQPGSLLVEVGESAYGVHIADDGQVSVQGLKRVMGRRGEKLVPDGEAAAYLQDGVLTELTSEQGEDAFDIATTPGRVSFYPESTTGAQDVRITAPAGYFDARQY